MPEGRPVDVGGVVLSVVEWHCPSPVAPPVVLLPGTGLTARSWDAVAASVCASRTLWAVDLRDHGESDWPGTYSIALMAQDVGALLETMAVPVDLVGHSLGGLVALRVAAAHGGRVRRLVLEDVAPTLVLAGGPRSFVAGEHVAELVAALPSARSVTFDTGHEVHEADPEGFTRELLAFLSP